MFSLVVIVLVCGPNICVTNAWRSPRVWPSYELCMAGAKEMLEFVVGGIPEVTYTFDCKDVSKPEGR
jgi:hypothetical protein